MEEYNYQLTLEKIGYFFFPMANHGEWAIPYWAHRLLLVGPYLESWPDSNQSPKSYIFQSKSSKLSTSALMNTNMIDTPSTLMNLV